MLIFTDGFDHTTTIAHKWTTSYAGGNASISYGSGNGRWTGSNALILSQLIQTNLDNCYISTTLPPARQHATLIAGVAVNRQALTTGGIGFYSSLGATNEIALTFDSAGALLARRGGWTGTVILTTNAVVPSSTWVHLELRGTLDPTAGVVEVRVNGVSVGVFSGQTRATGSATVLDAVRLASASASTLGAGTVSWDDLYLCNGAGASNNALLGDTAIRPLYPSGVGGVTQLTPTGVANNWDNVNEAPPALTDYNSSGVVDATDTYTFTDLPTTAATVFGVNVLPYVNKSDAGPRQVMPVVRAGGVTYETSAVAISLGGAYAGQVADVNPATGLPWTPTEINAAEFGVRVK